MTWWSKIVCSGGVVSAPRPSCRRARSRRRCRRPGRAGRWCTRRRRFQKTPDGPGVLLWSCAEVLQLLDREIVAGEVQPAVEEHRAVAGGEDEAVAVEPLRVAPGSHCSASPKSTAPTSAAAERQAEVAGVALVDGVHGEATGFVGGFLEDVFVHGKIGRVTYRHGGEAQDGSGRRGSAIDKPAPSKADLSGGENPLKYES